VRRVGVVVIEPVSLPKGARFGSRQLHHVDTITGKLGQVIHSHYLALMIRRSFVDIWSPNKWHWDFFIDAKIVMIAIFVKKFINFHQWTVINQDLELFFTPLSLKCITHGIKITVLNAFYIHVSSISANIIGKLGDRWRASINEFCQRWNAIGKWMNIWLDLF
jgi:hypothetical protein